MPTWLADRFARRRDGTWLDLATGARVVPIARRLGASDAVSAWLSRCARLAGLWHSHLVPLVDYVRLDGDRIVEVYADHEALDAIPPDADAITVAVARFLSACGVSVGSLNDTAWAVCEGRASILPSAATGMECFEASVRPVEPARVTRSAPVRSIGLRLELPEALRGVLAVLDAPREGERAILVRAAPGLGATTLLRLVAREARLRGLCALSPALAGRPELLDGLRGRRVALLCDRDVDATTIARALARLSQPHVDVELSVRVTSADRSEPRGLALRSWAPTRLAEAVCLSPARSPGARFRLAQRTRGCPGALASRWLGSLERGKPPRSTTVLDRRTRELPSPARHWGGVASPSGSIAADRAEGWNGPERAAGPVSVDTAWRVLGTGRAHEAARLFSGNLSLGASTADPRRVIATLRGLGLAELDAARLDRASTVLRRAAAGCVLLGLDAGRGWQGGGESAETRLAWVRCLLWQNHLEEAVRILSELDGPHLGDALATRAARYRARTAWRRGDGPHAWRALGEAARCAGNAENRAAVACDRARLALACGDRDGCDRALASAARDAKQPRRWMLIAAIQVAHLATGSEPIPHDRLQRLAARLARRDVPMLIRLRVQHALEAAGRPRTRDVAAFVDRWGLDALLDGGWATPATSRKDAVMVKDLQAVLEICRDSIEALPALGEVCTLLRDRLGASVVSVYGAPLARGRLAQSGAPRFDSPDLARRTLDSGLMLEPTPTDTGIEAAAPVAYAGQRIGAVTCRWAIDSAVDRHQVQTLLLGAATALAPHVQGLNDAADKTARRAPDQLGLLGVSAALVELRDRIRRVAGAPFHVLIEGESGSGKELVARALHLAGPRASRRFCAVNCAALTDELFEAELFGHVRGAFTGAVGERIGLFEDADGGTLFLDEIGELSPRAQAKLLRAIQDGEIRRVGETLPRRVDARIVAATNRALAHEAEAGRFRADLLYRLDVIRITVPPLRDRPEDIAVIGQACWVEAAARVGSRASLHVETLAALARYQWPGNVRELQNVVRALAVNAPRRGVVGPATLPHAIAAAGGVSPGQTLDAARRSFEERFVRAALARAGDRPGRAARDLGLTRQGLRKLLLRLGIDDRRDMMTARAADDGRRRC